MRRSPFVLFAVAFVLGAIVWPASADRGRFLDLFGRADYDAAREYLVDNELAPGENELWSSRLTTDPERALDLLDEGLKSRGVSDDLRLRLALDAADIEFGRGRYRDSYLKLQPIIDETPAGLPGATYLRAGLALRALGESQRAREMLASVKPEDPVFHLARYYLGDIGLDQDDATLALRYFDAAATTAAGPDGSRVAAGRWRALRAEGRDAEAAQLVADLQNEDPGGLGLLEIRRLLRTRQEELLATNSAGVDSVATVAEPADRGRYALQLGAFSDRGLALEFQRRHLGELPDLRIDEVRDARGQFLYKLRTGSFVNPALARTEARRLADRLDIDVIVADLSLATGD